MQLCRRRTVKGQTHCLHASGVSESVRLHFGVSGSGECDGWSNM